jgi:hypothetical protein
MSSVTVSLFADTLSQNINFQNKVYETGGGRHELTTTGMTLYASYLPC